MRYRLLLAAVIVLGYVSHARAADWTFTWDPSPTTLPNGLPATPVAGYEMACGSKSGTYTIFQDAKNLTTYKWVGLPSNTDMFCAVRAYDAATPPSKSAYSNEVVLAHAAPPPPGNLKAVLLTALNSVLNAEKTADAATLKKLKRVERSIRDLLASTP
jgi:hypothetical protein